MLVAEAVRCRDRSRRGFRRCGYNQVPVGYSSRRALRLRLRRAGRNGCCPGVPQRTVLYACKVTQAAASDWLWTVKSCHEVVSYRSNQGSYTVREPAIRPSTEWQRTRSISLRCNVIGAVLLGWAIFIPERPKGGNFAGLKRSFLVRSYPRRPKLGLELAAVRALVAALPAPRPGQATRRRVPASRSRHGCAAPARPVSPHRANQLRVSLGTIPPATDEMRTRIAASARCQPDLVAPGIVRSICIGRLATPSTVTGTIMCKLRQLRPSSISYAMSPTRGAGNIRLGASGGHAGGSAETEQASRPSSHDPADSQAAHPSPQGVRSNSDHDNNARPRSFLRLAGSIVSAPIDNRMGATLHAESNV